MKRLTGTTISIAGTIQDATMPYCTATDASAISRPILATP